MGWFLTKAFCYFVPYCGKYCQELCIHVRCLHQWFLILSIQYYSIITIHCVIEKMSVKKIEILLIYKFYELSNYGLIVLFVDSVLILWINGWFTFIVSISQMRHLFSFFAYRYSIYISDFTKKLFSFLF